MDRAATHFPTDDQPIGAVSRADRARRPVRGRACTVTRTRTRTGFISCFGVLARWLLVLFVGLLAGSFVDVRAAEAELTSFELSHNEEGVLLNYAINVELSHSVDDALGKAVPLYFVAETEIFRNRWYWRDQRVAHALRIWKIVFQPLTSTYRVSFGGLSQNFDSRDEALASITRAARWKVAEPGQVGEGGSYYIEFSFRLDTSLLPRPMQIGIGGQPEWTISVQRSQRIN